MNKAGKMKPVFERIGKYYYDNPSTYTNGEFDGSIHIVVIMNI